MSTGLRERRKQQTRQAISDVATGMFAARGFDDVTISQVAAAVPAHRTNLVRLRDELRTLTAEVAAKNGVSAKVAGAMMGHLNSVVRMVSGAVRQAGVYTRQGQHTIASRVGVMERVA